MLSNAGMVRLDLDSLGLSDSQTRTTRVHRPQRASMSCRTFFNWTAISLGRIILLSLHHKGRLASTTVFQDMVARKIWRRSFISFASSFRACDHRGGRPRFEIPTRHARNQGPVQTRVKGWPYSKKRACMSPATPWRPRILTKSQISPACLDLRLDMEK